MPGFSKMTEQLGLPEIYALNLKFALFKQWTSGPDSALRCAYLGTPLTSLENTVMLFGCTRMSYITVLPSVTPPVTLGICCNLYFADWCSPFCSVSTNWSAGCFYLSSPASGWVIKIKQDKEDIACNAFEIWKLLSVFVAKFVQQLLQLEGRGLEVGCTQGGDSRGLLPHTLPPRSPMSPGSFAKIMPIKKFF